MLSGGGILWDLAIHVPIIIHLWLDTKQNERRGGKSEITKYGGGKESQILCFIRQRKCDKKERRTFK